MEVKYVCPFWGFLTPNPSLRVERGTAAPRGKQTAAGDFIDRVIDSGYDGIEIDIPNNAEFEKELLAKIESAREKQYFIFIAQQWLPPANESFENYKERFTKRLGHLTSLQPDLINSHTGKDFFSFEQNCLLIETATNISARTGIRILHETHRGRFSFHLPRMLSYLKKFPELELVADISHWCTVSESLLEDQEESLQLIIPHAAHIHARVGYEHSPQVNDFRAPEWKEHVNRFVNWWQKIIDHHKQNNKQLFTICPEFGPVPYMPTGPFTQQPLADQWEENVAMMEMLKERFS
jgi:sugar phosphate isomerase/epimerase